MRKIRQDLIDFRNHLGMNHTEFAKHFGLVQGAWGNYEQGRREPTFLVFKRMRLYAKQYGIELPDSLFSKEVKKEQSESDEVETTFTTKSLKEMREYLGMNQDQIAKELGISYRTLGRYERGDSKPLASTWFKIKCYARQHGIDLLE